MQKTPDPQELLLAQEYHKLFATFFIALDQATAESLYKTMNNYPRLAEELFHLFSHILCMNTRQAIHNCHKNSQTYFGAFTIFSEQIPTILCQDQQAAFKHHQTRCVINAYAKTERDQLAQVFLERSIGVNYMQQYASATEVEATLVSIIDLTEQKLIALAN